jgi:hypothetical protein
VSDQFRYSIAGQVPVMPRYYFNLLDGRERIIDTDGLDLDIDQFPFEHVLRVLEELRTEEDPDVVDEWVGWRLEIVDAQGQIVRVVAL